MNLPLGLSCVLIFVSQSLLLAEDGGDFQPLFNGRDLSGWHGDNPHKSSKSPPAERMAAIERQQPDFLKHWHVVDGELVNDGQGPYATSDREFGDIELRLEYQTVPKADSGIYLRGAPQIQIWDTTRAGGKWDRNADAGSGGLFNNSRGAPGQLPLRLADKPFGQWNQFRIIQVGSRTWVELNHLLVVDGAIMENYWDRSQPLPRQGRIHLQTHGGEIRWRNIAVREIGADEAISRLRGDDAKYGFQPIFNGQDLTGWTGAVDDYEVRDQAIVCKPDRGGVLFTERDYENFKVRLEFKLPPGGNNGLAIRYPGTGRASYDGMCELQVLDDYAEKFAELDPRQYHGSVYGMVPAHRGYLYPAGTWNYQEVTVDGPKIKVELNGTVIVDADVSAVHEFKDDRPHPGKDLVRGHFGFAGHGHPVMFRRIAIKELPASSASDSTPAQVPGKLFSASFDESLRPEKASAGGKLVTAESPKRETLRAGNQIEAVSVAEDAGVSGGALRFAAKTSEVLMFSGNEVGYRERDWSGSVSMWLKLNPDQDLEPGYCDPIQITTRAWNDAALFVDFDRELPRDFRLGVFPDIATWNPEDLSWEEFPVEERPMVVVKNPPFSADKWTHVCFTWQNINATDGSPAVATLYLNGEKQGAVTRPLQFSWQPEEIAMMLGVNYIGLIDELSTYDRALTQDEVKSLFQKTNGDGGH